MRRLSSVVEAAGVARYTDSKDMDESCTASRSLRTSMLCFGEIDVDFDRERLLRPRRGETGASSAVRFIPRFDGRFLGNRRSGVLTASNESINSIETISDAMTFDALAASFSSPDGAHHERDLA